MSPDLDLYEAIRNNSVTELLIILSTRASTRDELKSVNFSDIDSTSSTEDGATVAPKRKA